MEAFDNNETGIMLWDPDDVLVYINKATQDFINSLGASITIGIKFEEFTKNLLNIKSFSEEHYQRRKTTRNRRIYFWTRNIRSFSTNLCYIIW